MDKLFTKIDKKLTELQNQVKLFNKKLEEQEKLTKDFWEVVQSVKSYKVKESNNYITIKEASELLGVSKRTINEWCKLEKIPATVKTGKMWLINKNELKKWIKEQEQRVNPVWLVPKYQKISEV